MSMLSCRVFCLLAIVLCCVGVSSSSAAVNGAPGAASGGARSNQKRLEDWRERSSQSYAQWANGTLHQVLAAGKMAEQTLKMKTECAKVGETADVAARDVDVFAITLKNSIETVAAKTSEVEQNKEKGRELIKKAEEAAEKAREFADKTEAHSDQTFVKAASALEETNKFNERYSKEMEQYNAQNSQTAEKEYVKMLKTKVEAVFDRMTEKNMTKLALKAVDASEDSRKAALDAYAAVHFVEGAVKRAEEAMDQLDDAAIAAEKEKKGKKRGSDAADIPVINTKKLLLLLSVLGCMTVC
ncbi:uncharacterized protein TM35_000311660 [Trypanosoma theileri]|uniref:Surface protein TolT n=1 Tax=Trypanosoma theileri TaxID=67003 RepID=A0A1X0NPC0_9TRYP|nr:uncharacterized protein TM35_000311660 [Trypanosoma theileri]ORC85980.1 hypothetical protein TM35_000311660 [Trypanosoma theileri]